MLKKQSMKRVKWSLKSAGKGFVFAEEHDKSST